MGFLPTVEKKVPLLLVDRKSYTNGDSGALPVFRSTPTRTREIPPLRSTR
jgi:hypothetical protein